MNMSRWLIVVKQFWKPLSAVFALMVLIVWTTGVWRDKVEPGHAAYQPGFALPADAPTYEVRKEATVRRLEVTGTVTSEDRVQISARLSAHVRDVFAGAGQSVAKDDVLIVLDDRELREQLAAAQAQLRQAETEYQRTQQLFESKAATQQALIAAESMYQSAQAQVDQVNIQLSFTEIRSPIDGMVTDRRIEAGDLAHPGQVLLAVYNPEAMRLDAPVPVRLVDRLALGDELTLELESPAARFAGEVTEIVSEIDPVSRTRLVKVRIHADEAEILPGTFGRLWVDATPQDGVMVPQSAVYRVGQLEMVQVVQGDRVIRRLVKTGPVQNDMVEVLSGLGDGEVILVNPVVEEPRHG